MTNNQHEVVSAEQVKDYLRNHPNFFEKNATLLTEITLPNPHGNGGNNGNSNNGNNQCDTTTMKCANGIDYKTCSCITEK